MGRSHGIADSQLGHWWLPDDPDNRVAGSLITLLDGRQVVQMTKMLPGAPLQLADSREYPVVHGQLFSGLPLTLLHVVGIPTAGKADSFETLYPESAIEGGYLSNANEPFSGASIGLPHLIEWLGTFVRIRGRSAFPLEPDEDRVTVKVPGIGEVSFAETSQVKADARGRTESKDAAIFIQLDTPAPKRRIDEIVRVVRDMVTFFSGIANPLVRYELIRETDAVWPVLRVLEWSEYSKPDFAAPTHPWHEMVLRADDDLFDAEKVIPKWFEVHRAAPSSLNQILAFSYVPAPFQDVHFLALVYALEGLHRKFEAAPDQPASKMRTLIEQATARLDGKTQGYLKYLLDRAADPTLEQRLIALATVAGGSIAPLLATFPDYAARIARTRNVMAHQLEARAPITSVELSDVINMLRFLAEAYLLRKLGWTEDQVQWIFHGRLPYSRLVSYRGGSLFPQQP